MDNHTLKTAYNVECSWSMIICPKYTKMSPHEVNEIHMLVKNIMCYSTSQGICAYPLQPECWQLQITWAVKPTFIILCQSRFRCLCLTFCLSISYSFSISSHLAVPVSHLPFIVISHPRFSALQACPVPLPTVKPCIKMEPESAEVKMSYMCLVSLRYIFKAKWTPSMTQVIHNNHCLLQCIGQLLIISSEFNIRGMTKLNL
jgi:hypothetical protein